MRVYFPTEQSLAHLQDRPVIRTQTDMEATIEIVTTPAVLLVDVEISFAIRDSSKPPAEPDGQVV